MFLTPSDKQKLRQHAVFLDDHLLSDAFHVDPNLQIENLLDYELPLFIDQRKAEGWDGPVPVMLWAHGGNVMRSCAIREALDHIDLWLDNGIYPIYFLWDSGPGATAADAINEILHPDAADLAKSAAAHETYYQTAWDMGFGWLAKRVDVPDIWSEMKEAARTSNEQPDGGAYQLLDALFNRADKLTPEKISLHAVGHSAGAIFLSWFIPNLLAKRFKLTTLQLLAPAVRIDLYEQKLLPLIVPKDKSSIGTTVMFTMHENYELADRLIGLYQQGSLLYFIRDVLERDKPAELLGLEESFREASADVHDSVQAVFTPTAHDADEGKQSNATSHVAFPSDSATLNSIAHNILGREPVHPFPPAKAAKATPPSQPTPVVEDEAAPIAS